MYFDHTMLNSLHLAVRLSEAARERSREGQTFVACVISFFELLWKSLCDFVWQCLCSISSACSKALVDLLRAAVTFKLIRDAAKSEILLPKQLPNLFEYRLRQIRLVHSFKLVQPSALAFVNFVMKLEFCNPKKVYSKCMNCCFDCPHLNFKQISKISRANIYL